MSTADWFARKMAKQPPQQQQPQRQALPPTAAPTYTPPPQPLPQPGNPHGPKPENMTQALAQGFTPNASARAGETGRCPQCNSNNYFSRATGRAVPPAPHCTECGFNGLYSQGVGGQG